MKDVDGSDRETSRKYLKHKVGGMTTQSGRSNTRNAYRILREILADKGYMRDEDIFRKVILKQIL
jgi:hypothetical protein